MATVTYCDGWRGGDSRTLYAFTDTRTHAVIVRPGGDFGGMGPACTVRVATREEAERLWQSPLHPGWLVDEADSDTAQKCKWCGEKEGRTGKHLMFCSHECEAKYWEAVTLDNGTNCPDCGVPLFGLPPGDCACHKDTETAP